MPTAILSDNERLFDDGGLSVLLGLGVSSAGAVTEEACVGPTGASSMEPVMLMVSDEEAEVVNKLSAGPVAVDNAGDMVDDGTVNGLPDPGLPFVETGTFW